MLNYNIVEIACLTGDFFDIGGRLENKFGGTRNFTGRKKRKNGRTNQNYREGNDQNET